MPRHSAPPTIFPVMKPPPLWVFLCALTAPSSNTTFTNIAATVANRTAASEAFGQVPDARLFTRLLFQVKIKTADGGSSFVAPTFSVDGSTYKFFDAASTTSTGGAAAPTMADVYGVLLSQAAGWYQQNIPMPSAARINNLILAYATAGGAGNSSPVISGMQFWAM